MIKRRMIDEGYKRSFGFRVNSQPYRKRKVRPSADDFKEEEEEEETSKIKDKASFLELSSSFQSLVSKHCREGRKLLHFSG